MPRNDVVGVNYFDYQFLQRPDFEQAREHHVSRLRQHAGALHTRGIVEGLRSRLIPGEEALELAPGLALTWDHREVVLQPDPAPDAVPPLVRVQTDEGEFRQIELPWPAGNLRVPLDRVVGGAEAYYLTVRIVEEPVEEVTAGGVTGFTRLRERVVVELLGWRPGAEHPHLRIARLTRTDGAWTLRNRMRRGGSRLAPNVVGSANVAEADGTTAQDPNRGRGIKTRHLQDGAVTTPKLANGAVTSPKLAAGAVGTAQIADGSITQAKLAAGTGTAISDDAVTSAKIAEADNAPGAANPSQDTNTGRGVKTGHITNRAVTTDKLADLAVTEGKLAAGAVTSAKLGAAAVATDKLADGAVSTAKLANLAVTTAKLADGSATTAKLADAAVSTAKLADGSATTAKLADGGVSTAKLADGSVTAAKLANGSVTVDKIGSGAVTGVKLADESVGTAKLADASVTAAKLGSGSVTADKIASSAVTNVKLGDGSVGTSKLASGAVTADKLGTGAVTNAKLAASSVSLDKLKRSTITGTEFVPINLFGGSFTTTAVRADRAAFLLLSTNIEGVGLSVQEQMVFVSGVLNRRWQISWGPNFAANYFITYSIVVIDPT